MTDLFGEILLNYLNGQSFHHIIRREDGFIYNRETETCFTKFSDWPDYEKILITRYAKGKVLDIGAGSGRHSLFLQENGAEVHAIDRSPSAIRLMKIRGVINTYLMDYRKLSFPRDYFDCVLLMFLENGLGGTMKGMKRFLDSVYKITKPSGKIIATLRNPQVKSATEDLTATFNLKPAPKESSIRMRIEQESRFGYWFYSLMVAPEQVETLVGNNGWQVLDVVKGNDGFYGVVLEKKDKELKTDLI